ncbi:hypothetical protein D9758_005243 [Tetrapyrgos nigripes]|uniref:Uncharacterized protein n=1 Tax=Tetrapyrgos nigripes TaxID=182062 RepID=A0A8H5GX67_9AGAR|nr:hypothetical protein D9758_005243 [Tetrapyrgos nigripes]
MTLPPLSEKEDSEPVISGMKVKEGPEEVVIVVGYLEHGISAYYVHRDNLANVANLQLYWTLGPRQGHFLASWDIYQCQQYWVVAAHNLCNGIELYATNPVSEPDIAQYGQLVSATGLQHKNRVLPVGFLADGQWLVYGSARGNTFIIDHNTGRKVEILNDHNDPDCSVFSLANDDKGVERIVAGTRDGWDGSITVYKYNETIAPETPRGIPLSTSPNWDTKSPTLEEGGAPGPPSSVPKSQLQNESWKSCFINVLGLVVALTALALGYYGSRPTSSHEGPSTTTLVQPGSAHTVDPVVISGERFPHPSPMTTVFKAGTSNTSPTKHTETVTSVIAITDTMTITMSPDTRTVTMAEKMTVTMSPDTMTITMAEKMMVTMSPHTKTVTVLPAMKTTECDGGALDNVLTCATNDPTVETVTVTASLIMETVTGGQEVMRAIKMLYDEVVQLKEKLDSTASLVAKVSSMVAATGDWSKSLRDGVLLMLAGAAVTLILVGKARHTKANLKKEVEETV